MFGLDDIFAPLAIPGKAMGKNQGGSFQNFINPFGFTSLGATYNQNMPGYDPNTGMPTAPEYQAAYNPATMSMASNPELAKIKSEANRSGPSKAANLMIGEQNRQELMSRDANARTAGGSAAKARSDLAMRGGLSSGARERTEQNAVNDVLNLNQQAAATKAGNVAQIGINDEQNRQNQMQEAAQLSMQAQQFDTGNQIQSNRDVNAWNQNLYNQNMANYWNMQQANQQYQNSQKPSSFICTALKNHGLMTPRESLQMVNFMLGAVLTRADFFAWYFSKGKEAVDVAEAQGFDWSADCFKEQMVDQILFCEKVYGTETAQSSYIMKAGAFCTKFLGECGYRDSMARTGMLKSILALPKVFMLPNTWKWLYGYMSEKLSRKARKLFLRWRVI